MHSLPDTVNYHFTSACNMRCRFCFAGFNDCRRSSLEEQKAIIRAIAATPQPSFEHRSRRLNFVGGEPTICPHLEELILEATRYGLRTSIVSNGFRIVEEGLPPAFRSLKLLGLSIDSLDAETNVRMGRAVRGRTISAAQWMRLFDEAGVMGLPVKINTVVNACNRDENMAPFIAESDPLRWKVFQAMPVEGQNCHSFLEWTVDRVAFDRYVDRHVKAGVQPVVESEEVMRGSYAMISPDGRFYDSTSGTHRYSDPILAVGVERAWGQVIFSHQKFADRTRSYGNESIAESRTLASIGNE